MTNVSRLSLVLKVLFGFLLLVGPLSAWQQTYGAERRLSEDESELHRAVGCGRIEHIEALLKAGADPNVRDEKGRTPLMTSAQCSNYSGAYVAYLARIAELLLDYGADVNAQDDDGYTPLMAMVIYDKPAAIRVLLQRGAKTELKTKGSQDDVKYTWARTPERTTVLLIAAEDGSAEAIKLLLEHGADVRATNERGQTALDVALLHGRAEVAGLLATQGGVRPAGQSLLALASGGNIDVLRAALRAEANPNVTDEYGQTPLIEAAQKGRADMVELLIQARADINHKGYLGRTALIFAAEEGHLDVVNVLLQHHADMDIKSDWGQTALTAALEKGYRDIAKVLLEAGVDVVDTFSGNWQGLHLAAKHGYLDIIQTMLGKGARWADSPEAVAAPEAMFIMALSAVRVVPSCLMTTLPVAR